MASSDVSPLKKHIDESPKIRALKERRLRRKKRIGIASVLVFLVLLGTGVYLSRLPKIQITHVSVSGNRVIDTESVTTLVDGFLAGSYLYVIPHRNAFFYPREKIITALATTFPRFKTIAVTRTDMNTLAIVVTEIKGRALWCGADTTSESFKKCYFTDESGKIVSEAPDYSGNVYPRFFGGTIDSFDTNPLGKNFLDETTFQKMLAFQSRLEDMGFHVKALRIGTGEENTFVLDLGQGATALVRFLKTDDYATLVANLTAALGKTELAVKLKTDKAKLQYFDLRFTNKVYYKFGE